MDEYAYLRTGHRVYGKSIRQLAKETGHSRNTVREKLKDEYQGYRPRRTQPYPVLGNHMDTIDSWLRSDKESPKKQRHTARRIYHRLRDEEGYMGCESTVRRYVRAAKRRLGVGRIQAYIPLEPDCGQEAEVDWGSVRVLLEGEMQTLKLFCMRSKYSGKHFVRVYPCERQIAFFDAHQHAFAFFGGVFPRLIYDNLTSAVKKVLRGRKRQEQESFTRFRSYYSFKAEFCNPGQGHEKGGVEGLVGFARRNYFVPMPKVKGLEELNKHLVSDCLSYGGHRLNGRENTVNELFERERTHLVALPEVPFSNITVQSGKVDKYATVIIDKNRYSTPTHYAHLKVKAELTYDRVRIYYDGRRIAEHERVYRSNHWIINPDHYLDLLQQRPKAFRTARPIRQWRAKWPESYEHLLCRFQAKQGHTKGIKDFISVLQLCRDHSSTDVTAAVELALEHSVSSSEGVKHILLYSEPEPRPIPLSSWESTPETDVSVYDQIGAVK